MEQAPINPEYTAFQKAEEQACQRYLTARKDLITRAARAASLAQLAMEHPGRQDYHQAWTQAVLAQSHAMARTGLAYRLWQRAQHRTDTARLAPALLARVPFTGAPTAVA